MIDLNGKSVLITGASKGIGAASARVLLAAGARVAAHWNTAPDAVDRLQAEFSDQVAGFQADLSEQPAVDRLWSQAHQWAGRVDAIVNNAALMPYSTVDDDRAQWDADWDAVWRVNVRAVADLCRHAVLAFKDQGGGTIVNVASRAGFRGDLADAMHYAASKGAVVALTRSLAKSYAREKIFAYTIAPGWIRTDRVAPRIDDPANAHMLAEIPMGDAAPPDEVGNIIAFLVSGLVPNATGATIDINGASYFH